MTGEPLRLNVWPFEVVNPLKTRELPDYDVSEDGEACRWAKSFASSRLSGFQVDTLMP